MRETGGPDNPNEKGCWLSAAIQMLRAMLAVSVAENACLSPALPRPPPSLAACVHPLAPPRRAPGRRAAVVINFVAPAWPLPRAAG
ncbi:unnamed protein product [Amoebophrya sp. A120]|nr:unnamed protein product [Amoebophrya sp. A120]|eukprot:GSA120T00009889001.1